MNKFLHPDDYPLFLEVTTAMRIVAKKYALPLKSIEPEPNPEYRTSSLGKCFADGMIYLVFRGKTNGTWDTTPRRREDVWKTGAHELAHLRHFNHGLKFQEFEQELITAMQNEDEDPQDKIIKKILKLKTAQEGEDKIGNSAAAEAFAGMINRLMIEHELSSTDLDYELLSGKDPIVEIPVDLGKYHIPKVRTRVAWQESLARIVANGHLCTFLLRTGSNQIWFVGTKTHATVAEYAFGTLVPAAALLSDKEAYYYRLECRRLGDPKKANGFRESWLIAFVERIGERMREVRADAVRQDAERRAARGEAGDTSQALIRLTDAMKKVHQYMDEKFKRRRKYASSLNGGRGEHSEGRARGRAAADAMPIGRKGVGSANGGIKLIGSE